MKPQTNPLELPMSDCTLYYNPHCGSCRNAKEILESRGIKPRVVEYLKTPPTVDQLEEILKKLGAGPDAITRNKEPIWQEEDRSKLSRKDWLALIAKNPILLQRPIVVMGDRAVIARPPEKAEELFRKG
jgi:arsenate reductase (glutaredoxin)